MSAPILAPAAVLILWSLVVLLFLVVTRFPAFAKVGLDVSQAPRGARYSDVEASMPPRVNWVSHNFTHLMEQPTLFYAVVMILALSGEGTGTNVTLAWAYAVSRIVHSLWQIGVNIVWVRVGIFAVSSTILLALAVNAVRATLL
jgi:hypothetical protein